MSLLDKATTITTPTAHSNGVLHSIKGGSVADFDVLRGSAATRVNAEGLIEDIATNIPRIDYTDGTPSLLLEPQSINLITYSEDFSSLSAVVGALVTSNQTTSPSGLLDADEMTFNGSLYGRVQTSISATNGATYAISVYLKNKDLSDVTQVWLGFAQTGQGQFVTITNEWQRHEITLAANGTTEYPRIQFSGTGSLYAWGFQTEELPYSTSYIPTSGAIATRLVDKVIGAGDATTFNSNEGVLYVEMAALADTITDRHMVSISDDTSSNSVFIRFGNASNLIEGRSRVGGANVGITNFVVSDETEFHKIAYKRKLNDYALWIDGVEVGTATGVVASANTFNTLNFHNGTGSQLAEGKVKSVITFDTALTDAELQCLTTI